MSLLREVLRKTKRSDGVDSPPLESSLSSRKNIKKGYAASVRSSGGASIRSVAETVASFYSTITGSRIPKRRRADFSRLGVPMWYRSDPLTAGEMDGTEHVYEEIPLTAAHAVCPPTAEDEPPWLCVVLYNHGSENSRFPLYFNEAKVQGELRLVLRKAQSISSVDVWCIGKAESVMELGGGPFLNMHANLWKRSKGDPRNLFHETVEILTSFKGKLPAGSYVFPFEFPAFPRDACVELPPETADRARIARVFLPPSCQFGFVGGFQGSIRYIVGVNLTCDGLTDINEEYDIPLSYYPRFRPLPRETISPFPFISTREDWPFRREVIGGWTLTPFGGRGRFDNEVVEIEGILGVQTPEVYAPGQTVRFGLLIWSTSPIALQALSLPEAIDVVLIRSDVFGTDVLRPRNSSRRNRTQHRISQGRVWRTNEGPPPSDEVPQLKPVSTMPSQIDRKNGPPTSPRASRQPHTSRFQTSYTAEDLERETLSPAQSYRNQVGDHVVSEERDREEESKRRSFSPTPSLEDLNEDEELGDTVRMDGDVRVVRVLPPSFRYKYMGCEYYLQLTIMHPRYSHISPSGPGILAETPIWVVTDPPRDASVSQQQADVAPKGSNLSNLPISGKVVDIGVDAIRTPLTLGEATMKERPTWRTQRLSSF